MKSRVHPKYKTKYRVKNWASYDRGLVRRGHVTVWLSPEAVETWEPVGVGRRGGQLKYSNGNADDAKTGLDLIEAGWGRCRRIPIDAPTPRVPGPYGAGH